MEKVIACETKFQTTNNLSFFFRPLDVDAPCRRTRRRQTRVPLEPSRPSEATCRILKLPAMALSLSIFTLALSRMFYGKVTLC